MKIIKHRT